MSGDTQRAARRAAVAVSSRARREHEYRSRHVELGVVRKASPLQVELMESHLQLEEEADLRLSAGLRAWDATYPIVPGDVLCLVPLIDHSYLAFDLANNQQAITPWGSVADNSVSAAKLQSNSVSTIKIQDGAVTPAKLSFDPATQAELDTHAALTTTAHGGIVASVNPSILMRGTLAARPAAAAGNLGLYYFATDDTGGRLARSTGAAWENISLALSDTRLTDARTPSAHKTSHQPGGADAIDYTLVNLRGTLAARPAAAAGNTALTYLATDDAGGTTYRSTGSAWEKLGAGVTHAAAHLAGGTDAIDWVGTVNKAGTLASRPAAASTNSGYFYVATDTAGGTLYRSDGSAWLKLGAAASLELFTGTTPLKIKFGTATLTWDGSGQWSNQGGGGLAVTHGLGATPVFVWASHQGTSALVTAYPTTPQIWNIGATTFTIQEETSDGQVPANGQTATVNWAAIG